MKLNRFLAGAAFSLAVGVGSGASATTQTLTDTGEGWVNQGGTHNGSYVTNNTITGNCGLDDCNVGEFRSFYSFDVPSLSSPLSSATLLLNNFNIGTLQSSPITLHVSGTASFNFYDLGAGTPFGDRTYTSTDSYITEGIVLNSLALSAIGLGGETFTISARISSPTTFAPDAPDQFVMGGSYGAAQLELNSGGVPEPASWALMIGGFGLAGAALRRRRAAVKA